MFRETAQARRRRTALEITDESVRILDVTIARRPAGAAGLLPAERFAHLCLDATFLAAARNVAIAAHSRLPCALEGDTAVAKTTAVLWVAHLCRQEAVRLNLNGQSDTGELVGRFVPAVAQDRGGQAAWRFWEGIVPDAMRHGRWVVLDELNLAEPQVLERLNPVLEQHPSLVLSENGGERYGLGGDVPLADTFRIFATMNPGDVFGEIALIDGHERSTDAIADEATEVLELQRDDFIKVLENNPKLTIDLLRVLCMRIRQTNELLEDFSIIDLRRRLAKRLAYLNDSSSRNSGGLKLTVRVSQEELVAMMGVSQHEAIHKQLQLWEQQGIVAMEKGWISIADQGALSAIVEEDF
jgi:CRP-like cAMP-binding protein